MQIICLSHLKNEQKNIIRTFSSKTISKTVACQRAWSGHRRGDVEVLRRENPSKIRLGPCLSPQFFQSRAASEQPRNIQAKPDHRFGRVASTCSMSAKSLVAPSALTSCSDNASAELSRFDNQSAAGSSFARMKRRDAGTKIGDRVGGI